MTRVADETDCGSQRRNAVNLSDHTATINDRLAGVGAGPAAFVDFNQMRERVKINPDQLGDDDRALEFVRGVEQAAQTDVFNLERVKPLQSGFVNSLSITQSLVLGDQLTPAFQGVIGALDRLLGQGGNQTQGVERGGEELTDRVEQALTFIGNQECKGEQGQQDQSGCR